MQRDFDAVTAWVTSGPRPDPPLSAATWRAGLNHVTPETGLPVGIAAYEAGQHDISEQAHRIALHNHDQAPKAMVNLGFLFRDQGRVEEAEAAWRDAIATGHPDQAPRAMVNLGHLLRGQRRVEEAEAIYRQAIATGHPDQAPLAGLGVKSLRSFVGRRRPSRASGGVTHSIPRLPLATSRIRQSHVRGRNSRECGRSGGWGGDGRGA